MIQHSTDRLAGVRPTKLVILPAQILGSSLSADFNTTRGALFCDNTIK